MWAVIFPNGNNMPVPYRANGNDGVGILLEK